MEKSDSIKNISASLQLFQLKVDKVKKDSTNPFFKSKYASLSNILEAIHTPLQETELAFSQLPTDNNGLTTILIHTKSGEYFQSTYIMPVSKQNDPQAVGSALTYARRYALVSILGLNVDDDDDGNAATKAAEPVFHDNTSDKPWLNQFSNKEKTMLDEKFIAAQKFIKDGGSIVDIEKKYKLSKDMKTLLQKEI